MLSGLDAQTIVWLQAKCFWRGASSLIPGDANALPNVKVVANLFFRVAGCGGPVATDLNAFVGVVAYSEYHVCVLKMASRLTTPSSATAERGAVAAWWSERETYELRKRNARTRRAQAGNSSYRDTRSRSLQRMVRRCGCCHLRLVGEAERWLAPSAAGP